MSRIFKKLNIEDEPSSERSSPDLKLVPPSTEESVRPPLIQAKISNPQKFKKLFVPLSLIMVCSFLGMVGYRYWVNHQLEPTPVPVESVKVAEVTKTTDMKSVEDEKIHHEGTELYRAGDYVKALEKFQVVLKKYPKDSVLNNNIGLAYLKLNDIERAEMYFQEALKSDPKDSAIYSNLGSVKISQQNWDEAISYFYQAILYHPEMIEPHLNLAKAFEMAGRPMEAIPEYQHYLDHSKVGGNPEIRKLVEQRIVKLNSFSRYIN